MSANLQKISASSKHTIDKNSGSWAALFAACQEPLGIGSGCCSVAQFGLEFLSLGNHLLDFRNRGNAVAEVLGLINLHHLWLEIGSHAVAELFHGVDTCGFKEFGKLTGNTFYAEQVGMVGPFENEFFRNVSFFCKLLALLRSCCIFEEVVGSLDSGCFEFLGVNIADTLDFYDFVGNFSSGD